MSHDEFGDDADDLDDPLTFSPAVQDLLADVKTPADVYSAVVAFLVDVREHPFPDLAMPVPGRPGMYSAPLRRDVGLVEYAVNEDAEPPAVYVSRILRAD